MNSRAVRQAPHWYIRAEDDIWLGQLARAAQGGDHDARDTLWVHVGPRLIRLADGMAWSFPTLEHDDAMQESFPLFVALVTAWDGPAKDGAGFAIYLFGMFRWRLLTLLRTAERRSARHVTDWAIPEERTALTPSRISASVAWHEYGVDFPAFVESLPPREREIFLLRLRDGLETREIARRLGLTPRTISRYWNLTVSRLRAIVQQ